MGICAGWKERRHGNLESREFREGMWDISFLPGLPIDPKSLEWMRKAIARKSTRGKSRKDMNENLVKINATRLQAKSISIAIIWTGLWNISPNHKVLDATKEIYLCISCTQMCIHPSSPVCFQISNPHADDHPFIDSQLFFAITGTNWLLSLNKWPHLKNSQGRGVIIKAKNANTLPAQWIPRASYICTVKSGKAAQKIKRSVPLAARAEEPNSGPYTSSW